MVRAGICSPIIFPRQDKVPTATVRELHLPVRVQCNRRVSRWPWKSRLEINQRKLMEVFSGWKVGQSNLDIFIFTILGRMWHNF